MARLGLGWDPLMGRRLGASADEQRARLCARARASCQWRQLANYTGRLLPIADMLVILEEKWANGQVYVVKNTRKWAKKRFCVC